MFDPWLEVTVAVFGSLSILGWAKSSLNAMADKYGKYEDER